MFYTPIKNKEKQVSFAEYEKDLKKRSFEGRVCYIIKIIYGEKTGQRHETIKIGFTDTLFDKKCPFSGKKIRGRIYTIMSDLQRTYGYAKVVEILMVFKEHDMSSASIKRFESFLLKDKSPDGTVKLYRIQASLMVFEVKNCHVTVSSGS